MNYEQLEKKLLNDLNWRTKEFAEFSFMLGEDMPGPRKKVILKASITLLYSHWEGHIKYCAMQYLKYVNEQRISCKRLTDNFKQIYTGKHFNNNNYNFQNIKTQQSLYNFFIYNEDLFEVNTQTTINTQANLKYQVFTEILMQLGFPIELFNLDNNFIDNQLLKARNIICHGDRNDLLDHDLSMIYDNIKEKLLKMIQDFHQVTLDYASNKKYLSASIQEGLT